MDMNYRELKLPAINILVYELLDELLPWTITDR